MKPIESRLKTHSRTWLTPVLLIFIAFFAMAMVSNVMAEKPVCDDPELTWPKCEDSGGGDGGKGGMGELGNACAEFYSDHEQGWIYDDGDPLYCNGQDGQVSIPTRFRMDSKKWNKEDRKYYVWAECLEGSGQEPIPALCNGVAEVSAIQSQIRYDYENGEWMLAGKDVELRFQEMTPPEWLGDHWKYDVARVSMSVLVGKQRHLYFGDDQDFSRALCRPIVDGGEVYGEPVWVRCDANSNADEDGLCDRWTVSTFELDVYDLDIVINRDESAHACLMEGVSDVPTWDNVQADFILDVCVLGVSCPQDQ